MRRFAGIELLGHDIPDETTILRFRHLLLGLCPGTKISGGKVLSATSKRTANRLAQALRMSAVAAGKSHSALGARRLLPASVGASWQGQGGARHGA
jgi:hypothetical protein